MERAIERVAWRQDPLSLYNGDMNWDTITTVLLDMDGTLLDKAFDDHFYSEALPERYAAVNRLSVEAARERLFSLYRAVEGELDWTDLDYWTRTLDLDVPAMKDSLRHRIAPHPDSLVFLSFLRARKMPVHLVTNAHPKTLALKMAQTGLDKHLDRLEAALVSAERHGIKHLYHRAKSSSAIPPQASAKYRSIETFHALME